jgi:Phage integrase family
VLDQPTIGRSWVDLENGIFYRQAFGKRKQKNKQQTPVRLPPRLLAHLRRWKRKGISIRSLIEWNGEPVKRINKAFRSVRREAGFANDVVPHTLRHTCATWLAQHGVPTWEAAGYLGMTEKTFIDVYGHHHPDHQKNAVNAFGSPRQFPDRYNGTERERGGRTLLDSPINIELFEGHTRSGRGGRRFKSCHSDQPFSQQISVLSHQSATRQGRAGTVIGTETTLRTATSNRP